MTRFQSFYKPAVGDIVIGVVTQKYPEQWKVNIRAANEAMLPTTAFIHATKQHSPNLTIGSIVILGVASAHKDYETVLTGMCHEDQKGWSSGENYLGELKNGFAFEVTPGFARILLAPECLLLTELGMIDPYEVAVGVNGRVWVRGESTAKTIEIANAIKAADSFE